MIVQVIETVLSLVLLIGVGWWIAGRPWCGKAGTDLFSKFTAQIAIPCYMFYNMLETCGTREELLSLFIRLPGPLLTIFCSLLLALALVRLCRVEWGRRGVFLNAVTFSNVVIIGFPVVTSLFGEGSLPAAMRYYMANTLLFWTLGVYLLRRFGGAGGPQTLGTTLRGILSPSILGMLAGLLVVLLELPVPQFLFSAGTTLKGTTTALAMVFVGCVIRGTDFSQMKLTRDLAVVVLVRLLLFPVFVGVLVAALPIDSLTKQVYFVFATMPAMTQMGIMARETGSDYEFAAVLITVTTILSMAAIPIYMGIVTHFHLFL